MNLYKYLVLLILFCNTANAQLPPPVALALKRAGIPESAVGLYVHDTDATPPVAMHRGDQPFNPASVMKLVTTYAGLELLGPAYEWTTEIHSDGVLRDDVLHGNLYLRGSGDPRLVIENFWLMLRKLRAKGLREIRGDLVLDHSIFTTDHPDPGLFDGEPLEPYNTPPDALLTNFKAFTITFRPDAVSRTVRIIVDPPLPQLQIVNELKYVETACGYWQSRIKTTSLDGDDTASLTFSGTYALGCGEQVTYYSLLSHRGYVGALFRYVWRQLGGTFNGRVRDGVLSAGALKLVEQKSQSLAEIVRHVNKFSNNVMARQILLSLGANGSGLGTPERGVQAIRQLFASKGIHMPGMVIENGSGLSRIGRVTARGMGQLLLVAYRSAIMPEFMASMPIVGVDGTMQRRLADTPVAGQAHVKTGLINDVRALAGYVLDAHGRRVVTVLLINHPRAGNANAVQDALLQWVHSR